MKDESDAERQHRLRLFPDDVIVNPWVVQTRWTCYFYAGMHVDRKGVYRWPEPAVLHQLTGDDLRLLVLGFFDEDWYVEYERKREPFIPTSTAATTAIIITSTDSTCANTCTSLNYHVG